MAFLIPALGMAAEAALAGGAGLLGAHLVGKIVGDAEVDNQLVQTTMDFLDPRNASAQVPLHLAEGNALPQALEYKTNLLSLPVEKQSRLISEIARLRSQLVSEPGRIQNLQTAQSVSDASALALSNPQLLSTTQPLLIDQSPQPQIVTPTGLNIAPVIHPNPQSIAIQNSDLLPQQSSAVQLPELLRPLQRPQRSTGLSASSVYPPMTTSYQASQPYSKNMANQGHTIQPPSVPGQSSSTIRDGVGTIGNYVKEGLVDSGKSALADIGSAAGVAAVTLGSSLITKGSKLAAQRIGDFSTMLAKKIIGDAPPRGNSIGSVFKIIGDAPPGSASLEGEQGDVMTPDQTTAAVANVTSSPTLSLVSWIQIEEQMLQTGKLYEFSSNIRQASRAMARMGEEVAGIYRAERIASVRTQVGIAAIPHEMVGLVTPRAEPDFVDEDDVLNESSSRWDGAQMRFFMRPTSSLSSVPLLASATLTTLGPLLSGSSLTEYSRELRLTTNSFNYDMIARMYSLVSDNIAAQSGYSFVRPLIVLLDALCDRIGPIPGSEMGEVTSNYYVNYTDQGTLVNTGWFAWDDSGWKRHEADRTEHRDGTWLTAAVIDEVTYMKAVTGLFDTGDWGDFRPHLWGQDCAVVFIPISKKNDAEWIACWTKCFMGHPISSYAINFSAETFKNNGEPYKFTSLFNRNAEMPGSALEGPTQSVLYVVVGSNLQNDYGIAFGTDRLGIDNNPTNPAVVGADGFGDWCLMMRRPDDGIILEVIRYWEETYGTASERASAMRIVACNRKLYRDKNYIGNGQLPGHVVGGDAYSVHHFGTGPGLYQNLSPGDARHYSPAGKNLPLGLAAILSYQLKNPLLQNATSRYFDSGKPISYADTNLGSDVYFGERNPIIDLLVMKKLLTPGEEYPMARLDKGVKTVTTLYAMADQICGVVDLAMQSNNVPSTFALAPQIHNSNPNSRAFMRNKITPPISQLLEIGIQFPQVHLVDTPSYVFTQAVAEQLNAIVYSPANTNTTQLVGVSRIPTHTLAQYVPSLSDNAIGLQLGIPILRPRANLFNGALPNGWVGPQFFTVDAASDALIDDIAISKLLRPLSRGVILNTTNVNSTNYGLAICADSDGTAWPVYFHLTNYDYVLNTIFVKSYGAVDITVPPDSDAMLPHDEKMVRRIPSNAFRRGNLLMTGPRDIFSAGSGAVYSYNLFNTVDSPANIQTTTVWNADNDLAYRLATLTDTFNY